MSSDAADVGVAPPSSPQTTAPPRPRPQRGRPAGPLPRRPPGAGGPSGGNGVQPPSLPPQTSTAPPAAPLRAGPPNPGRTAPPRGPPRSAAAARPRPPGPLPARPAGAPTRPPQQQTDSQNLLARPADAQQQPQPRPPASTHGLRDARPHAPAPAAARPPPATGGPAAQGERVSATQLDARAPQSSHLVSTAGDADTAAGAAPAAALTTQQPGGSGGGWGSLGGWTSALRQVATSVSRDVTGLTTSFQQALAEVDDCDVSDEEGRGGQQAQEPPRWRPEPRAPMTSSSARGRPPPAAAAASMQAQGDTDSEAARRRALAKLEGDDSQLRHGVKALDKQVDQLAIGALQKVAGLWGNAQGVLRAAAQSVTETVEEGVRDVSSLHAVKAASGGLAAVAGSTRHVGAQLATEAETRLQTIGKQAYDFLEAPRGKVWDAVHAVGGANNRQLPGFQSAFEAHGGRQTTEELEDLSNAAVRRFHACWRQLDDAGQRSMEAALVELPPALDMATAATPRASDSSTAMDTGRASLTALCSSAKGKADDLMAAARSVAEQAAGQPAPPEEQMGKATEHQSKASAASDDDVPAPVVHPATLAKQQLAGILAAGSEQLGEAASLCMERMLALARSVGAFARFRQQSDDGIEWPAAPLDIAHLLCAEARRMEEDLLSVATVFSTALHTSVGAFSDAVAAEELPYDTAMAAIEKDAATASAKLQEALRGLMYVVMLVSLDPKLLGC